jgi:UPF0716 protein FxsA
MPRLLILALLAGLPLGEIYLTLRAAADIGAMSTLLLLILGVFVGMTVMRHYGLASLARLRSALAGGQSPARPMLEAMLAQLAGLLLILPGFISDAVAVCLLIAPLRRWLAARMAGPDGAVSSAEVHIIEGEFSRRDED